MAAKSGDTTPEGIILEGQYHYGLVTVSVALAMFAAYAALDLAGQVTTARGWARGLWFSGGAIAMGLGIWAMHYIAMLAFSLPVPVLYHYPTVMLSLLAAIAAAAVALFTVSQERMGTTQVLTGSVFMGGGIAAMHYIGMDAMRLPARMEYRWSMVTFSVLLAMAISFVALVFSFQSRREQTTTTRKIAISLIMGSAIPLMHYTGMWAVQFRTSDTPFSRVHTTGVSSLAIGVISVASLLILLLAIATTFLNRFFTAQKAVAESARAGEDRFRMLAQAIPQIVWTAQPDGDFDYCNSHWSELTGLTAEESWGSGWKKALHPDDLPVCEANWARVLKTGDTLEAEYRLRSADGKFRWHQMRAKSLRDAGGNIVKWFGAFTDIEEQMHNQQALEEQLKEHTAALMDANARLQAEMKERNQAQRELNEQNEKMVNDLTRRSQRATMLAKMAELLQSCAEMKDVFSVISGMAPKIFPDWRGAVMLFNSARKSLEVSACWANCELPGAVFEPQDCWALRTGHLHVVEAGDHTAECMHVMPGDLSYVCLPLLSQGEAAGILHFQMTKPGMPTEAEFSLASTFADQVGLSVANLRLRDALKSQSIRDALTGLYNRRYLEETLEREIRRASRSDSKLGLIILDLDHFKSFNDTYGHEAGDTVLQEVATCLVRGIRTEDAACRYGGEEFVIILPTASLEATRMRAEKLREKVRELSVRHLGKSLGTITISMGVAEFPMQGTSPKDLMAAADAALYQAKREGRDRVAMASDPANRAATATSAGLRLS